MEKYLKKSKAQLVWAIISLGLFLIPVITFGEEVEGVWVSMPYLFHVLNNPVMMYTVGIAAIFNVIWGLISLLWALGHIKRAKGKVDITERFYRRHKAFFPMFNLIITILMVGFCFIAIAIESAFIVNCVLQIVAAFGTFISFNKARQACKKALDDGFEPIVKNDYRERNDDYGANESSS